MPSDSFTEVGGFIWQRLGGPASVREIAEAVAGEFEVTPEQAHQDTLESVASLESAGLIEPAR